MTNQKFLTIKTILFIITVFLLQLSVEAETVILRSHDVIHGRITFQDANVLRINDDSGKALELQKNDILKVSYRDVKDAKEIKRIIEEEEKKLPAGKRKIIGKADKKTKWNIVWRSAILPGWGQWKAGKRLYAVLPFLAVAGTGLYTYGKISYFNIEGKIYNQNAFLPILYLRNFSTGNDPGKTIFTTAFLANNIFQPYGNAQVVGNNAIQLFAGVFVIQLIHSYFVGRDWEKEDSNTTIGKKTVLGDWSINAYPRLASSPSGFSRESYYEMNYMFKF